jgi:endonuclease/exonuclease/phosphatase family metal-dependent hydrolase
MRVMFLNAWGGRELDKLLSFMNNNKHIDVICLQEIFSAPSLIGVQYKKSKEWESNLFYYISQTLRDHSGFFSATSDHMDAVGKVWVEGQKSKDKAPVSIGNAIFVKKNLDVQSSGDIFVHGNRNSKSLKQTTSAPKTLQYVVVGDVVERFNIFNFHGLWTNGAKVDCQERLDQSTNMIDFIDHFRGKKILGGDFNLEPDTKSVKILENNGQMVNLINKFGIKSTRTKLYRNYETQSHFADYVFVSQDILVDNFYVNHETSAEVSDHAPLFLSCS